MKYSLNCVHRQILRVGERNIAYRRGGWLQNSYSNRDTHYLSSLALEFRLLPGVRQSLSCIPIKKQTKHNNNNNKNLKQTKSNWLLVIPFPPGGWAGLIELFPLGFWLGHWVLFLNQLVVFGRSSLSIRENHRKN